ncbi:MAG: hypothetical protein ACRDS9_29040 [Pseudonocardiaceae bacterium]
MGNSWVEIDAVCEVHRGSGRLVIRREGERIVLDGRADECCVITMDGAAVTLLFDVLQHLVSVLTTDPRGCRLTIPRKGT